MGSFALLADFFVAMLAIAAVRLLGANVAPFHDLTAGRVRQFAGDFDVELEEALERDICGVALHALVWDTMFGPALRTFDLSPDIVD